MAAKRISMRHIKDVLRLKYDAGLSQRQISKSLSISLGAVSEYLRKARDAQISWPLKKGLTDD